MVIMEIYHHPMKREIMNKARQKIVWKVVERVKSTNSKRNYSTLKKKCKTLKSLHLKSNNNPQSSQNPT